jgi:hypothetical protein
VFSRRGRGSSQLAGGRIRHEHRVGDAVDIGWKPPLPCRAGGPRLLDSATTRRENPWR